MTQAQSLFIDAEWLEPTWTRLVAVKLQLPIDDHNAVSVLGTDLIPIEIAPSNRAHFDRFAPKWLFFDRPIGNKNVRALLIDDGIDGVTIARGHNELTITLELYASDARPFVHDAHCNAQWRAPNRRIHAPERLMLAGDRITSRVQLFSDPPIVLQKTLFPEGRRAALLFTDHADQTSAPTLATLLHGHSSGSETGGFLGHHVVLTKALFAHGALQGFERQLEDPRVVTLADELYRAGGEIVPHSATPSPDDRQVTQAALELFSRWQTRTWIDHQPETNCEAFGDLGFHSGGRFGIADLLSRYHYEYIWAELDRHSHSPDLNLFSLSRAGDRTPTVWPLGRLDSVGPSEFWMFRSTWSFMSSDDFFRRYDTNALDHLEQARGLHIAHTYLESLHEPGERFFSHNLLHREADGTIVLLPKMELLLADLERRQARGSLWIPTLVALADRLRRETQLTLTYLDAQHITLFAPRPIAGATFVALGPARPALHVEVDGAPPRGLQRTENQTTFWVDLSAGTHVVSMVPLSQP